MIMKNNQEIIKVLKGTTDISAIMHGTALVFAPERTVTGVPPITLTAKIAGEATSYKLSGNGSQTGTPSPDNIIMPTFCGVRTGNLFDLPEASATQNNSYYVDFNNAIGSTTMQALIAQINSISGRRFINFETANSHFVPNLVVFYDDSTTADIRIYPYEISQDKTVTNIIIRARSGSADYNGETAWVKNFMLNSGSTSLPYEPFGWKIPITCAGQTVPVYLGQTQTVRRVKKLVLTGEETVESGSIAVYIQRAGMLAYSAVYCSHYQYYDGLISGAPDMAIATGSDVGTSFWFKDSRYGNDAADFKAYLAAQYAAGTPVTVWYVLAESETGIVNEPLMKIGDYADELRSSEQTPPLMLAEGVNVIDVDTAVKPTSMSITFQ